jgi:glycine cleavage system aminomethyltransferase T
MRLFATNDERDVGQITSATHSDRLGKEIALGFVKRGSNEIGTRLSARSASDAATIDVEIVELPFG